MTKVRYIGLYLIKDALEWKPYSNKENESECTTELLLRCSEMNSGGDSSRHLTAAKVVKQGLRPDGIWVDRDVVLYRDFNKGKK